MSQRLLFAFLMLFLARDAIADEVFQFYRGVRQEAMGGASIGAVDDETSLLLNPAAMAKLRGTYLTVANPVIDMGSNDDSIAGGTANIPKMTSPQTALQQADKNPGKMLYGMGEIFPSLVFPNFGIGILGKASTASETNTASTAYELNYDEDFALVAGFDFRIWNGIIKIGANARLIDRTWIKNDNLSPTATNLSLSSLESEGLGLGSDVGLIITAPIRWLPSLSAVVRDIGDTSFTLRNGIVNNTTTAPDMVPQTVNGAFTVSPILSNRVRSEWTFEYADITNATKDTVSQRHYHAGVEFNFADAIFLRGGYNEGYWTGGLEIAIGNYQIQATSYGEEVGTVGALQEDRRYMGSFSIRF